ncbi:MAG: sulfatase-like hydrolase/transferase, partial [Thermoprotei archaeon]|nr:sulfatase-like hydrolase/transferase [Thermoprotei archaeon]
MDTQRADNLSCYGYHKKTTPNIDGIAGEGVIFLNNIVPGVWTLPSHASLFTGRYVSGHGA